MLTPDPIRAALDELARVLTLAHGLAADALLMAAVQAQPRPPVCTTLLVPWWGAVCVCAN